MPKAAVTKIRAGCGHSAKVQVSADEQQRKGTTDSSEWGRPLWGQVRTGQVRDRHLASRRQDV